MSKKEKVTPGNACKCCGNDLYCDNNVYAETKRMADGLLELMEPKCIGRPTYLMIFGDTGMDVVTSPMFGGGSDILVEMMEDAITHLKAHPWEGNKHE